MKKKFSSIFVAMLVLVMLAACGTSKETAEGNSESSEGGEYTAEPGNIILASGPIGGGWYSTSATIAEILMREIPGLNVTVTEGGGHTNIEDVADGSAHIGYTFSDAFNNAVNGTGQYKGEAVENISGLGTLYQSLFQTIVLDGNSDYQTFADLKKGAHILPGKKTFSGQVFTQGLLENYYDTTYEDIQNNGGKVSYTGFSEMTSLLGDGHADVAMAMTAAPSSFVMELNSLNDVRFLEIEPEVAEKIAEANSGFAVVQMPANTYDNQTEPVNTIGSYTVMFVNKELPEELVERMVKAIVENQDELVQSNQVLEFVDESTMKSGFVDVPVHPGVENALQ